MPRARVGGGKSLEEWFHSYFNPVARVKRPKRGFDDDDGRPRARGGPAPSHERPTPCAVLYPESRFTRAPPRPPMRPATKTRDY